MKYPESFKNCDSTYLDLKNNLNTQGKYEIISSEISVIWASGILTRNHLSDNELLHIARSNPKTEYLKTSVKITFSNPFCICRIYPNGRILIMGGLTEQQAYKRLAKTVRKIKYRTKWKVILPNRTPYFSFNFSNNLRDTNNKDISSSQDTGMDNGNNTANSNSRDNTNKETQKENKKRREREENDNELDSMKSTFSRRRTTTDSNGLEWRYVENENILKVSEFLETFRIDQLFCKVVLNKELNLNEIYFRLSKSNNVKFFDNYLRFQFNLDTSELDSNSNLTSTNMGTSTMTSSNINLNERMNIFGSTTLDRYSSGFDSGDLDISQELERALESGIVSNKTRSCLVFKSGKISILGCINRSEIVHTFNQLIELLF